MKIGWPLVTYSLITSAWRPQAVTSTKVVLSRRSPSGVRVRRLMASRRSATACPPGV